MKTVLFSLVFLSLFSFGGAVHACINDILPSPPPYLPGENGADCYHEALNRLRCPDRAVVLSGGSVLCAAGINVENLLEENRAVFEKIIEGNGKKICYFDREYERGRLLQENRCAAFRKTVQLYILKAAAQQDRTRRIEDVKSCLILIDRYIGGGSYGERRLTFQDAAAELDSLLMVLEAHPDLRDSLKEETESFRRYYEDPRWLERIYETELLCGLAVYDLLAEKRVLSGEILEKTQAKFYESDSFLEKDRSAYTNSMKEALNLLRESRPSGIPAALKGARYPLAARLYTGNPAKLLRARNRLLQFFNT